MSKKYFLILALILAGTFLRLYNLNWGAPSYFHPDERNVIDLILKSSLANPETLFKGTFAYGNFPVILTLLLKPLLAPFLNLFNIIDPFAQTAVALRTVSAVFSILTLIMIYLCGKIWSEKVALLALFMAVFSTGFIQQAHFGTYDGFGAFSAVTTFYFLLRLLKNQKINNFYYAYLFIAIGAAAKINLLVLALFPILILLLRLKKRKADISRFLKHSTLGTILTISLTILLSPNYLTPEFRNALLYERGLVTGAIPVFYTQSFYGTQPVVFQFLNILPLLINPLLTMIFLPVFGYVLYKGIKTKSRSHLLLASFFLLLFLPQAFLHAKWTRYMVPTLPFIYLIIAVAIQNPYSSSGALAKSRSNNLAMKQFNNLSSSRQARTIGIGIILFSSLIFSLSYFITAFVKQDTRIEASDFAQNSIPQTALALTEPYDLGIMPFSSLANTYPFNFYDLDLENPMLEEELKKKVAQAEYLILPSQRLIRSRLLNKNKFPKGYAFYSSLTTGKPGYAKIYQTPCDIFCKITYLNNPVFGFEETASVFERPTVMIFKKSND